jgi:hypothetical protein
MGRESKGEYIIIRDQWAGKKVRIETKKEIIWVKGIFALIRLRVGELHRGGTTCQLFFLELC